MRLFLEKGYHGTSLTQILNDAKVSCSSFQNLFKNKDGVLLELVRSMFENQFAIARKVTVSDLPPIYVYGAETALQLTLTELNENLRDIYIEAYTLKSTLDYIRRKRQRSLRKYSDPISLSLQSRTFTSLSLELQASCEAV